MQGVKNTFSGGARLDLSDHLSDPTTYHELVAGRIFWNSTDDGEGESGTIMPLKGTLDSFVLPSGFSWIGSAKLAGDQAVIVSSDSTNSEIGITRQLPNDTIEYRVLYSDKFDPNGETLGFHKDKRLKVLAAGDSLVRQLIYILSPNDTPIYCVNIAFAVDDNGIYLHRNVGPTAQNTYPGYWSRHHFKLQPDAVIGEAPVYYSQTTTSDGGLPSGVYRYAYRLISYHKDIVSTWSHLGLPVFVTAEKEKTFTNHHDRTMGPSGKGSHKANNLLIENPDTRWPLLEIGYTHAESENAYQAFTVIGRFPTTMALNLPVIVQHSSIGGIYSLPLQALSSLQAPILTAADIELQDNRLMIAGPILAAVPDLDVSGVMLSASNVTMDADQTIEPTFKTKADPLTNSPKVDIDAFRLGRFNGGYRDFPVQQDYRHYKGVQAHSTMAGYRRESVTPWAAAPHDMLGQPMQPQSLGSFTAPTVTDNPLTKFNPSTGRYEINALGVRINGIKFKKSDIFDQTGKQKLSGFSLLRGESKSNILHQGLIFPTTQMEPSATTGKDPKKPDETFPLPFTSNKFDPGYDRFNAAHNHEKGSFYYIGDDTGILNYLLNKDDEINSALYSRPSNHNYFSPDVFIEAADKAFQFNKSTDSVKLVGTAGRAYNLDSVQIANYSGIKGPGLPHYYNKVYRVTSTTNPNPGRPLMGDEVSMRNALLITDTAEIPKYDPVNLNLTFENHAHTTTPVDTEVYYYADSLHVPNGLLLVTDGWESVDVTEGDSIHAAYHIVNYLRTKPALASDQTASDTTLYQYTAHFQPFTAQILATVPQSYDQLTGETYYHFDGIDVFGGDTYVNFTDFTRLMPWWSDNCEKRTSNTLGSGFNITYYPDYSVSHIAPLESKYNTSLSFGRRFARDCVRPESESCNNYRKDFDNGIMQKQPPSWNYNTSLLFSETIRSFLPKGVDEQNIQERYYSIYYSNQTIDGEIQDSKRTVLARNKRDLDGVYGVITNLAVIMDSLYCFQPRAITLIPTKNRELLSTGVGAIYYGTGEVLEIPRIINSENGCQEYNHVAKMGNSLYWLDTRTKHFCRFGQDGLSKLDEDRQFRVQTGVQVDALFSGDYYIAAHQNQKEVVVNLFGAGYKGFIFHEEQNALTTTLPVSFSMIEKIGQLMLVQSHEAPGKTATWGNGNWGEFFGTLYGTSLVFYVAQEATTGKIYKEQYISMGGDPDALDSIVAYDGDVQHQVVMKNNRLNRYWDGRWRVPLVQGNDKLPRLRGQILRITFTFSIKNNKPFILREVETIFNPSTHR